MTEHQNREALRQLLAGEGFVPEVTESGNLRFKYEGETYQLFVDPSDSGFIQIVRSIDFGVHAPEGVPTRLYALLAAADANSTYKCAKAHLADRSDQESTYVTISSESFVKDIESLRAILSRLISATSGCASRFIDLFSEAMSTDQSESDEASDAVGSGVPDSSVDLRASVSDGPIQPIQN